MNSFWWLAALTIPLLACVLWRVKRRRPGKNLANAPGWKRSSPVQALLLALLLNFGVWGMGAIALRGHALSGKIDQGRYYFNSRGHFVEVTEAEYRYSQVHTLVTLLSFPVAITLLVVLDLRRKRAGSEENRG